jgi:hypothetical protein
MNSACGTRNTSFGGQCCILLPFDVNSWKAFLAIGDATNVPIGLMSGALGRSEFGTAK